MTSPQRDWKDIRYRLWGEGSEMVRDAVPEADKPALTARSNYQIVHDDTLDDASMSTPRFALVPLADLDRIRRKTRAHRLAIRQLTETLLRERGAGHKPTGGAIRKRRKANE